jgi:polysaccharide biosynthesis protein PslH
MSGSKFRILFVTAVYPGAPEYGAQQRVLNICRLLSRFGKVSIAMIATEPVDQNSLIRTASEFRVAQVALIRKTPLANLAERIRFELDPDFLNTYFTSIQEADREALLKLIDKHDLVWIHTLRLANECGIYKWPRTVLDIDDIPSRRYQSQTQVDRTIARKLLNYRMVAIWQRRERRVAQRFEVTVVCSQSDREYLRTVRPCHVIPNGYVLPKEQPNRVLAIPPRLGFVGWFGGYPNVEGVQWFIRYVWPLVKKRIPEVKLRLVGAWFQIFFWIING